jgi:beta-galactosidase
MQINRFRVIFYMLLCGALVFTVSGSVAAESARERLLMDFGWKFSTENFDDAQTTTFTDDAWRTVDLPHDWSIEGEFAKDNPMGGPGGFFPSGIGWYRLSFAAPREWQGKQINIEFEGVYMNADVWINGQHLGFHPYGYTSFSYNLTPHLKIGEKNVLAVRVDNSKHINSRWYSGSGIYRHVWLSVTDQLHFAAWGTCVTTPEVTDGKAQVEVKSAVCNDSENTKNFIIVTDLVDPDGKNVGTSQNNGELLPKKESLIVQKFPSMDRPQLWSPETPKLYRAITRITAGGKTVDEVQTPFGIRSIKVSAENGFQLNGRTIKLCGGCLHHDNGCLGAAAFDRAEQRRVELLKAAGFNALRTAHNPPSPAFLDACDRLGMLVIDESFDCWENGKNRADYAQYFKEWWQRDIDAMILRDRNHPSVIMWSIGNEVIERDRPDGVRIGKMLADYVRTLDPTRPITAAICWAQGPRVWSDTDGLFALLDVGGYNYTLDNDQADHKRAPNRVMMATESFPNAAFDYWRRTTDNSFIIGDFVWTALDYLGESGIGRQYSAAERIIDHGRNEHYPYHGAYCGDLDLTCLRKPISHYRNILWNRGEKLYVTVYEPSSNGMPFKTAAWGLLPSMPSWTWPGFEGKELKIEVYSSYDNVRLYLNDKLIGEKPTTREEQFKAEFTLSYAPGVLKAVGMQGNREMESNVLRTVGEPAQIRLVPDRTTIKADGQDLSFVAVEVLDKDGQWQPKADLRIQFSITGPGTIIGLDNGDLYNADPYQGNQRKAYHGRALVVVRSLRNAGEIRLTAAAQGLPSASTAIGSRQ